MPSALHDAHVIVSTPSSYYRNSGGSDVALRASTTNWTLRARGADDIWFVPSRLNIGDDQRMRVLSVNVGLPREVVVDNHRVPTSIFKAPVSGRVPVRQHNLAGDQQSDLSVHGGPAKAVYAYPREHYAFWREELPGVDLQPGHFGENLTVEGLREDDVHVGDRLRVGTAELVVTQPRLPCYKLGIRFGRADMVKRFHKSERSGFYLSVHVEGDVAAGDAIEILERNLAAVSITELLRLYFDDDADHARLREVIAIPALPSTWRDELQERVTAS